MDIIDYKILACLKENARENATNIGQKINLSTSAVIERIRKMEAANIIKQYSIVIDQQKIGRELTAFISVRLEHPKFNEPFCKIIENYHSVVECHYIAGDFDYILKVITESTKSLEKILNDIKSISGVSFTRTSVVLISKKNEICILPEQK